MKNLVPPTLTSLFSAFVTKQIINSAKLHALFSSVVICILVMMSGMIHAQLVGTKNIPGDYATLALAITDLNAVGVGGGGVTLNLVASNPQTAPLGGYIIGGSGSVVLTTSSMANPIIIQGNGNTITAPTPQTVGNLNDGIFKLIGADWVTITGFTLLENPSNATTPAATNNMTEWGIALLYVTTTDGAQNNTIQSNTIDLNRAYQNTFGIYSNSTHTAAAISVSATATGATGGNHNLKVYGNTITDINNGIVVVGPTPSADHNNGLEIGATSMNANTISNYGTTGTFSSYANVSGTVYGILVRNTKNFDVSYNTITSSNGGTTSGTLRGIYVPSFSTAPTGTFTNSINNNSISVKSGVAAGTINGILVESTTATATSTLNINNNDFNNITHTLAATGIIIVISNASTALNQNINSNTFTNLSPNTTGNVTLISNNNTLPASGLKNVNSNSIVTGFNKTGAGGTVTCFLDNGSDPSSATNNTSNNSFTNITVTGATTVTVLSNTNGGSPIKNVNNNTINTIIGGTNAVTGLSINFDGGNSTIMGNAINTITNGGAITGITFGTTGIGVVNCGANTIHTLTGTGIGTVTGIAMNGQTTNTVRSIFKNKIYNLLNSNVAGAVNGITIASGFTINVFNNLIGDLRTTLVSAANPLNGINITSITAFSTINVSFNTVYLNATSTGAIFGSSAIFHTTSATSTTATLNMRNNILVNTSTANATGFTTAYRRSSNTLANYGSVSNKNLFYAGTPSPTNLIFTDATNFDQTLLAYKTRVFPRDDGSYRENPPFLSTTGSSGNFLHIDPTIATQIESAGIMINGITDDYDGDSRNVSNPDVGADEFAGIILDLSGPTMVYTPLPNTACLNNPVLSAIIIDLTGVNTAASTKPRVWFKKNTNANALPGTNTNSTDGWKYAEATNSSNPFNFTIDYSLIFGGVASGDSIQYFVVAQDLVSTPNLGINHGTFTTPPPTVALNSGAFPVTNTNFYKLLQTISTSVTVGAIGSTYPSLTGPGGFFSDLNAKALSANTTVTLDSTSIPETGANALNAIAFGCGGPFTLTIRPAGGKAVLLTGTSGVSPSGLIKLNGADRVIIDGLNTGGSSLTIENTSITDGTTVIWLASTDAGAGATNNTIKNCTLKAGVEQNLSSTNTYGIVVSGPTMGGFPTSISAGEDNDNNVFMSNTIIKVRYGIYLRGGSNTNPNTGTRITNNTIGPSGFGTDEIGVGAILVREEDGIVISGNTIQFVGGDFANTPDGADRVGITFGTDVEWEPISVYVKNALVTKNSIHDIVEELTFSAVGINIGATDGSNSTNNVIANNFIFNIKANGTFGDQTVGIGLYASKDDKVVFNSIYMTGDTDPNSASDPPTENNYGISIAFASVVNPLIKDNLVYMDLTSSSTPSLENACINIPGSFAWGSGSSNYNDLFYLMSNSQSYTGCVGGIGGNFHLTLANWQAATSQDANSLYMAPIFVTSTDLHLDPPANVPFDNMGSPVAGVNIDIDNQFRNFLTPDIGADEFTMGCSSIVTNTNDSGGGSLRDVMGCVLDGETVSFDAGLTGQTITFTSGEIDITRNVAISGLGPANLTLSGNNASRIFHLEPTYQMLIRDIALKNATSMTDGGAILVEGILQLQDALLDNNFENGVPKGMTILAGATVDVRGNVEIKE